MATNRNLLDDVLWKARKILAACENCDTPDDYVRAKAAAEQWAKFIVEQIESVNDD